MKSRRYRSAAKLLLCFGLLLCLGTGAVYCVLTMTNLVDLDYEPEYLLFGIVLAALFVMISLILHGIGRHHAKREWQEAVWQEENGADKKNAEEEAVVSTEVVSAETTDGKKLAVDKEKLKKIGMIAIPVAVVGAAAAIVIAKNAKEKENARRRRDFYKWLG